MRPAYYNEFDAKSAAWLRELIARGLIAPGDVDTRDIREVRGADLAGYTQCHFFAGIGGWSHALRLAGWPDDVPVWTGSCPCQPFSCAGKGKGVNDSRHLWPEFARLIGECRPATVFGEQVASRAGREWLAGVFADLEGMAYRRAGADLCAAGVGAPHIRQRLWWVANAWRDDQRSGRGARCESEAGDESGIESGGRGQAGRLAAWVPCPCECGEFWCNIHKQHACDCPCPPIDEWGEVDPYSGGMVQSGEPRSQGLTRPVRDGEKPGRIAEKSDRPAWSPGEAWSAFDLLPCRDGKTRRVESGTFPLAHGVPARVVRLRGYGNAIVPQVAAVFIRAAIPELTR